MDAHSEEIMQSNSNNADRYGKQDGIGLQLEEIHMIWFQTWELSMNSRFRDVQLVTSDCYWTTL